MKYIMTISILCTCLNIISSESKKSQTTVLNSYDNFGSYDDLNLHEAPGFNPLHQSCRKTSLETYLQELKTSDQPHHELPDSVFLNQE